MTSRSLWISAALIFALVPVALGASEEKGAWRDLASAPIETDFNYRTSVWTGKEMLVFGRKQQTALDRNGNRYATSRSDVAAAYEPRSNTWRRLEPLRGSTGFMGLASAWTGKEMIVWGEGTREAFNPRTNVWRRLPESRLLSVHDGFGAVVWTGRELIGWGGGCCGDAFSDGVAYRPATNTWRALARAPLPGAQRPLAAWTGREMVVVAGAKAAAYDPAKNVWRRLPRVPARRGAAAVWDGREVLVVGETRNGFAYSPAGNTWRRLPAVPAGRAGSVAVWAGHRLYLLGGRRGGAAYEPATNRWATLPRAPLPAGLDPTAVWTGRSLLVWGGVPTKVWGKYASAGAAFAPVRP